MLSDGQTLLMLFPEPVHYYVNDKWENIDNTLVAKEVDGSSILTNKAGAWNVTLPSQISTDSPISLESGKYKLSFSFLGQLKGTGETGAENAVKVDGASYQSESIQTSKGIVQDKTAEEAYNDEYLNEGVPDTLSSAIKYAEVFTGVDLEYELVSDRLKESVIINKAPAEAIGYQYKIEAEGMTLELQDDNSVYVKAAGDEKSDPIFVMPAPNMTDNTGAACYDIKVIIETDGKTYTLTYLPSAEWLKDTNRVYPVVLDPVFKKDDTARNIHDRQVSSNATDTCSATELDVGYSTTKGIQRVYMKYASLPGINSTDIITSSYVCMYRGYSSSNDAQINVHKVSSVWWVTTVNWANKPAYTSTVEDYQNVSGVGWYSWDITDIARGWFDNANTGMMFKIDDDSENGSTSKYRTFSSADASSSSRPIIYLTYRNSCGLESYWDYTTQTAGRAGTGYVSNYTGSLTWVHNGLSFNGNLMPVSINNIYNSNDRINNKFNIGYGWQTNYNQLVFLWGPDSNYMYGRTATEPGICLNIRRQEHIKTKTEWR